MAVLPMFPLGSVLLPGGLLPLHVFEPRYRRLVEDCLDGRDREFGVVLIERGSEVGGGDVRTSVGTVARMLQVAQLDDGRYAVVCVGTRRIQVTEWLPDDPYPRADVRDWDEECDDGGGLRARVDATAARLRPVLALAIELGDATGDPDPPLSDDPVLASYQLVGLAPVGPADRQRLLVAAGPEERLDLLDELLDEAAEVLRFRLGADEPDG